MREICYQGLVIGKMSIDGNNLHAPDNIPVPEAGEKPAQRIFNGKFDHNGLCHRSTEQCSNSRSELLLSVSVNAIPNCLFLNSSSPRHSSRRLSYLRQTRAWWMVGGKNLTYGEFLVWIGLWFMMKNIQGFQRHEFWSNSTIDPFESSPYSFHDIFPRTRSEEILKALTITDKPPPE